jgi:FAD/FMN-containing dehydrogenase
VSMPRIENALELFSLASDDAGSSLTAFEFIHRYPLDIVLRNMPGTRDPFPVQYPWYVLLEISGLKADGAAQTIIERVLEQAAEKGLIIDATIASSLTQARDFWKLREAVSEAQKGEGGVIKHDISVAVSRIPEFILRANALVERLCPGARPIALGHFGDGNVHYNVAQPLDMVKGDFLARWDEIMEEVHKLAVEMDGSISAEHGIGYMKRDELARFKSEVELDLMRRIKAALDPKNILNPGKVV